jgi:hypothetical protein
MSADSTNPGCACQGNSPAASCCGASRAKPASAVWFTPPIVGSVALADRQVPRVDTQLRLADRCGAWKMRWAIRRMDYQIEPGLYAVGAPTADSPVLVSANYKLSFDRLRSQLVGLDSWILVLDTKGINVWCAAGKGTFGTDELVRRIEQCNLLETTAHRTVIVPQLGAPGVAAHEVRKRTGVRVVYGPVRAADIPAFLAAGMQATPEMRRVRFPLRDRVALIPVELVLAAKWVLVAAVLLFVLAGLGRDGYSLARLSDLGLPTVAMVLTSAFGSIILGPALLPWLPGRPFSLKGLCVGLGLLAAFLAVGWFGPAIYQNWPTTLAWCLLVPSAASFLVTGFTGASTYTSLSGVVRETKIALPAQVIAAVAGLAAWVVGRFV